MKNLKYILFVLMTLSLLATACGSSESNTTAPEPVSTSGSTESNAVEANEQEESTVEEVEPVTLTIVHDWEPSSGGTHEAFAGIVEAFMAENSNIKIVQEIYANESIPNKIETAFMAGKEPDVILMNQFNTTRLWLDNGVTVPVQDYLTEWGMSENYFIQSALDSYTTDGGDLRAFPLEGFIWPILYRVDVFEAAGVAIPQTQEELLAATPALRAAGYAPFVVGGSDWTGFNFLMLQMQGCMENDEGLELATNGGWVDNANAQRCAEIFVQMRDNEVFTNGTEGLDNSTMLAEFTTDKAAMMMTGSWSFSDIPDELRENIQVIGFPPAADSPQEKPILYSSFNAKGVWITRNGVEKIDPVGKFISFLYKPENIAKLVEAGMVSPLISVPVDETKMNPLTIKGFTLAESSNVLLQPQDFFPAEISGEVGRVLREAYIPNGMSSLDFLEALDALY
ncbi:MAG TPA: extracellular solute-binding protein [Anaerolineaceae bacterium]|nr:extracellular solute-binding protein [Anaerolineaceae bacterium]